MQQYALSIWQTARSNDLRPTLAMMNFSTQTRPTRSSLATISTVLSIPKAMMAMTTTTTTTTMTLRLTSDDDGSEHSALLLDDGEERRRRRHFC
jgi:hypothetical protein